MKKSHALIVALAFLFVGCITFHNFWLSSQAKHWPSIEGVVTASSVYGTPGKGRGAHPEIHYQFQLNGQSYAGDKLDFGGDNNYGKNPQPFVAQYPAGKLIKIYYDPDNPENSVLFPEHNSATGNLILSLVLWLIALGLLHSIFIRQQTFRLPDWLAWLRWIP